MKYKDSPDIYLIFAALFIIMAFVLTIITMDIIFIVIMFPIIAIILLISQYFWKNWLSIENDRIKIPNIGSISTEDNSWTFLSEFSDIGTSYNVIYYFHLDNIDVIELVPRQDKKFQIVSNMFYTLGFTNNVTILPPIRNNNIIHVRLRTPLKYHKSPFIEEEDPPELGDIYFTVADHVHFLRDVKSRIRKLKDIKKTEKNLDNI